MMHLSPRLRYRLNRRLVGLSGLSDSPLTKFAGQIVGGIVAYRYVKGETDNWILRYAVAVLGFGLGGQAVDLVMSLTSPR